MSVDTPNEMVIRAEWIAAMVTPDPDEGWDGFPEAEAAARWDAFIHKVRTDAARKAWVLGYGEGEYDARMGRRGASRAANPYTEKETR